MRAFFWVYAQKRVQNAVQVSESAVRARGSEKCLCCDCLGVFRPELSTRGTRHRGEGPLVANVPSSLQPHARSATGLCISAAVHGVASFLI